MAQLLKALVKAQMEDLIRLANVMPTPLYKKSNMRRLQRFLSKLYLIKGKYVYLAVV